MPVSTQVEDNEKDVYDSVGVVEVDPTAEIPKDKLDQAERDKALALLNNVHVEFDPESDAAKRVLRKIDTHILPLLVLTQFLQNLDKASMSYAAVLGLRTDLKLTANEYSWLGSIVYFGFLIFEVPTHFILQRVPIAKYISILVILWGATVVCSAATTNFGGMAACRFLLGVFEATTQTVIVLVTGSWYRPSEQIARIAVWYSMAGAGQIFGGLLSYGMYHAPRFGWEGIFVVCGGVTIVHGVVLFLRLAASPTTAKFLSEEEKVIALERLRSARTGTESWGFSKVQAREALLDVRTYLIFILLFCTGLPNGGVNAFAPTLIAGFGFTVEQTTLLAMAPGGSQLLSIALAVFMGKTRLGRAWSSAFFLLVGMMGVILMLKLEESNRVGRYIGLLLFYWYAAAPYFILNFLASSVSGMTKKIIFNLSYSLGYCIGNIVGPQTYRAQDAPNYYPAKYTMLGVLPVAALMMICFWAEHYRLNRRNAKLQAEGNIETIANSEFLDLTDKQQHLFRYPY
ncbi:hypothetical protein IAT38_008363 [Cryptococcus sp. DSM 104549]